MSKICPSMIRDLFFLITRILPVKIDSCSWTQDNNPTSNL